MWWCMARRRHLILRMVIGPGGVSVGVPLGVGLRGGRGFCGDRGAGCYSSVATEGRGGTQVGAVYVFWLGRVGGESGSGMRAAQVRGASLLEAPCRSVVVHGRRRRLILRIGDRAEGVPLSSELGCVVAWLHVSMSLARPGFGSFAPGAPLRCVHGESGSTSMHT